MIDFLNGEVREEMDRWTQMDHLRVLRGGEGVMVGLVIPSTKRTIVPQDANDGLCDSNELLVAGLHVE